ncbi:beta-barrel assembly-enhancing protease [mine drainage metagenome]|uniref:Beta-barrel assembly-enhancing protease n=1 Tax=mine drainage metagenome TaxID=410659 RepID=A0A1J5TAB0_9ZZZZ
MIWLVFAVILVAVLALLLVPLLRPQTAATARLGYDVAVYKDQLAEVARDCERGLLSEEQAAGVRAEIQRRLLAAAETDAQEIPADARRLETGRRLRLVAGMLVLTVVPLGTLLIYGLLGSPDLPGQPYAARLNSPQFQLTAMADRLARHLHSQPDARGYVALGTSYGKLGRWEEAATAFRKAISMGAGDVDIQIALGQALAMANQGTVDADSHAAFVQALRLDPHNPQARFYLGLEQAQLGKVREAIAIWRDLQRDSPPDAPWLGVLKSQIDGAAKEAKLDPSTVPPQAPALDGPPPARPSAPAMLGPQAAMIRQMVDKLAARMAQTPDDFDGWMRLSRSYRVLNELDKAKTAAAKAIALRPKDTAPLLMLAEAQQAAGGENALPDDFVRTMTQVLELDPGNQQALYYVGAAKVKAGDKAGAKVLWEKLLRQLPADAPQRADLSWRIEALGK